MPTINQLTKRGRKPKRSRKINKALRGQPFASGTIVSITVVKPRKPNSAHRAVARVKLSTGHEVTCHVPGEGHELQEHKNVLVRGGGARDIGARYRIVRGTADDLGVLGHPTSNGKVKRKQGRSKYGVKKNKKKTR